MSNTSSTISPFRRSHFLLLLKLAAFPRLTDAAGQCWEAHSTAGVYLPNPICAGYALAGYSCAGDYCSAVDPLGQPSQCAVAAPSHYVLHEDTGRCVPPDWSTGSCFPGNFGEGGSSPCSPCTAGTFSASFGATTCEPCPDGLWSAEGAESGTSCTFMCGPGESRDSDFELDPCACSASGIIEGMDTGLRGCASHSGGDAFCHTSLQCTTANNASAFPLTKWRNCDPTTDNIPDFTCVPCTPGYFSDALSEVCSPCPPATFIAAEGATACTQCPPDRPTSDEGGASLEDCSRECKALIVQGCAETDMEDRSSGAYELFEGECGSATIGRPAYFNPQTEMYLYDIGQWYIGDTCGSEFYDIRGGAGFYPFMSTAPTWACFDGGTWVDNPMSITCSVFAGEQTTCVVGTYNSTGLGPEGACNQCPPHVETSFSGATSVSDCFTTAANIVAVSWQANRITAYSPGFKHHNLLAEGGMLDEPRDIAFISGTKILASSYAKDIVSLTNVEGEELGVFANVGGAYGLLFLHTLRMVVVASSTTLLHVYFFKVDDFTSKGTLEWSDAVGIVELSSLGVDQPRYMSVGETDSELLVTTNDGHVVRICVPDTSCDPQVRNAKMIEGGGDLRGICVIRSKHVYLLCDVKDPGYGKGVVYACSLDTTANININSCSKFAYKPEGVLWNPYNLVVDDAKQLVYIADNDYSTVHVFSFDGDYFGHLEHNPMFLTNPAALTLKPGPLSALSPLFPPTSATAGVPIVTSFTLHDRTNTPLLTTYNMIEDLPRFQVSATGIVNGLATTVHGSVLSASEATVLINLAGVWTVSITEGIKNPEPLLGSPYEITVKPAETDPAECEAEFERVLTAGGEFTLDITTTDSFGNPTEGTEFEFSCCAGEAMTKAGEYTVAITPAIKGNPFRFDVKAGKPCVLASTHTTTVGTDSLELRVFPKDEFDNAVMDATGYSASIDGHDDILLIAPDFSYTHAVEEGSFEIRFMLDGVNIKNSPVTIKVEAPGTALSSSVVGAIVAAFLSLLLVASFVVYWNKKNAELQNLNLQQSHELDQDQARQRESNLQHLNIDLQESLRKKKHSEEELAVMKSALNGLEKRQKDELKEVLIQGTEVNVSRLLGKGGFGVVNLATYRGQQTAVKQLLTINDESVKRFRFECFLMKSLRHPNIVKLVGVCWSDSLFACCLEFVENGSLEDWLRRTAGGTAYNPSKKKEKKKKKKGGKEVVEMKFVEKVFLGYNFDNSYNEELHTDAEKDCIETTHALMQQLVADSESPQFVWESTPVSDSSPAVRAYSRYNTQDRCGEGLAIVEISATPAQVMAYYSYNDTADHGDGSLDIFERTPVSKMTHGTYPQSTWGISDRDSVWKTSTKILADGSMIDAGRSVNDERKPLAKGWVRVKLLTYGMFVKEKEGSNGKVTVACRLSRVNPMFTGIVGFANKFAALETVKLVADPLLETKREVERLLGEYEPVLEKDASGTKSLTWKGQLLNIAVQCALGVQYLHQEQYWAEEEKNEDGQIIPAGYRQCIIHRDLKPDNMLLTKDWQLKLTDFGEARAVNLNQTMTSVGTPIYVAPEVMLGHSYDSTADSYSFGICLVAMIRGEKDVMEFYFQALRKTMKRKSKKGVGITILNNRMYSKGWRPLLPLEFERSYPKLCKLLKRCWAQKKEDRPSFDQIVKLMQGEVSDEVRRKEEPVITIYSVEDDALFHERMGKDEQFEDYGEEGIDTAKFVSRREFDGVLTELRAKLFRSEAHNESLKEQLQAKKVEKVKEAAEVATLEEGGYER